jgi:hypothetical protein
MWDPAGNMGLDSRTPFDCDDCKQIFSREDSLCAPFRISVNVEIRFGIVIGSCRLKARAKWSRNASLLALGP